jgi:hypothetical protein
MIQHQVHHRGQAHAMLSETSVSPPQLDEFFSAGEAPLRAGEFAELGWSEEKIWDSDAGTWASVARMSEAISGAFSPIPAYRSDHAGHLLGRQV